MDVEERALKDDGEISQILVPLHHPGHWMMVQIDLEKKVVTHYDSYKLGQDVRTRRVKEKVVPLMLHHVKDVEPANVNVEQGKCAMQDSNDCGVYTIANGIALLQKNGEVGAEINGVAKRRQYAARVLQARFSQRIRLDAMYTEEEREDLDE